MRKLVDVATRAPVAAVYAPTPLASLQLPEIPTELHFVRDHFTVPAIDAGAWELELLGHKRRLTLSVDDIRDLPRRTLRVVLECAGHRRTEMRPTPPGLPWAVGAVAEARWTGTSLATLLRHAGIPSGTLEVVLEGADGGEIEGVDGTHQFARSLPLPKALSADVLVAYETNGQPIPVARGGPVRAIVPGWYATDSVKWLSRIWFTSQPFGGFPGPRLPTSETGSAGAGAADDGPPDPRVDHQAHGGGPAAVGSLRGARDRVGRQGRGCQGAGPRRRVQVGTGVACARSRALLARRVGAGVRACAGKSRDRLPRY